MILSDLHRGARDGADDFRAASALQRGARLVPGGGPPALPPRRRRGAVGERRPRGPAALRRGARAREGSSRAGRYERFWGNHDDRLARSRAGHEAASTAAARHPVRRGAEAAGARGGEELGPDLPRPRPPGHAQSDRCAWLRGSSCASSGARSSDSPGWCDDARERLRPARQARQRRCSRGEARAHPAEAPADDRRPHAPPGLRPTVRRRPPARAPPTRAGRARQAAGARRATPTSRPLRAELERLVRRSGAPRPPIADRAAVLLQHRLLLVPRRRRHGPRDRRRQAAAGALARRRWGGARPRSLASPIPSPSCSPGSYGSSVMSTFVVSC